MRQPWLVDGVSIQPWTSATIRWLPVAAESQVTGIAVDVWGTDAVPLTAATTLAPAVVQAAGPAPQLGWFQVAPVIVPAQACPTTNIVGASPTPLPAVQSSLTACRASSAATPAMSS